MTTDEKIAKIFTILEMTTKNVDTLTTDVKGLIDTLPQFARVDEKYKSMDKRLTRIEAIISWIAKIAGTVLLMAIMGTVIAAK